MPDRITSRNWWQAAACQGIPTDEFFPDSGGEVLAPRATCASCPAAQWCRVAGVDEQAGVWGGTTPSERVVMRARLNISERDGEVVGAQRVKSVLFAVLDGRDAIEAAASKLNVPSHVVGWVADPHFANPRVLSMIAARNKRAAWHNRKQVNAVAATAR